CDFLSCDFCVDLLYHLVFVMSYTFTFFFFNDTPTTEIYTLSLHDALPILGRTGKAYGLDMTDEMLGLARENQREAGVTNVEFLRSEEHTSELQSRGHLVCRLLLEKKKTQIQTACYTKANTTDN